jgi:MarR family transcriptional regulator, organic hydroperoxide resistance regulator
VQRIRDPKDRRKYYVSLKDEGRRLVDDMFPVITDMISASLNGIPEKDMRVFWKVMHRIEKNLAQMSQGDTVVD